MRADVFLDTNVLVYAAAGRGDEARKREVALELLRIEDFGLSAQVLQEFYVTVVHKLRNGMPAAAAMEWIEQLAVFPCVGIDTALVKIAAEISQTHGISYWDGAILAAAEALGAHTLLSEDLGDGQRYGAVTVRNPFAATQPAK
jgi:predicted nucleic acid-binding protein